MVPWAGSKFLLFGGRRDGTYTNDLWAVDPLVGESRAAWSLVGGGGGLQPTPRAYHTANVWRGQYMIVLGGVGDDAESAASERRESEFWVFGEEAGWRPQAAVGEAPFRRCHHTASFNPAAPDSLYVCGGYAVGLDAAELMRVADASAGRPAHQAFFDVHELSLGRDRPVWRRVQTENVPPMLWGHAALFHAGSLVVHGGVDASDGREARTMCVWHAARLQWRWVDFDAAPPPRALHAACAPAGTASDKLYVVGGFGEANTVKYGDVWEFSAELGAWAQLPSAQAVFAPRSGHAACFVPGRSRELYVHGGVDATGTALSDTLRLDLATGTWTTLTPIQGRDAPATVASASPEDRHRLSGSSSPEGTHGPTAAGGVALSLRQPLATDRIKNLVCHFIHAPHHTVAVANPAYCRYTVEISTENGRLLEEELLRRCLFPTDPLRARLGVTGASWARGDAGSPHRSLPLQGSAHPLELHHMTPFTDDRRHVQSYHHPDATPSGRVVGSVLEVDPPTATVAPGQIEIGVSQGVQTAVTGSGTAGTGDGRPAAEEEVIRRQRAEIEALNRKVRAAEDAQKGRDDASGGALGFLRLPDCEELPQNYALSASTQRGPELTLTTTTIADMLPSIARPPGKAAQQTPAPRISAAAAAHVTRSNAAATVERRAALSMTTEGIAQQAGFDPNALPTASMDPVTHEFSKPPKPAAQKPALPPSITGKSPSLRAIVNGSASMLSITHLGAAGTT